MAIEPKKYKMPMQDASERSKNFNEVDLGYTPELAQSEAKRCLNCKNKPCVEGCPVNIDIPSFITKIKEGDYEGAYKIISNTSSLPAVCGRVCPQEKQCEMKCTLGIKFEPVGIGRLERFAADWHNNNSSSPAQTAVSNGHRVAVVGSGPAGLTCAGDLARMGYDVTVYEPLHVAGGVLVYGIPEFRLPKAVVQKEIENLKAMGVKIETNTMIGKTFTVDELLKDIGFEAVFIGTGAGLPKFMSIPGETLKGVYSANEFLTRINLMNAHKPESSTPIETGKNVVVVGGGNVAMDAARCARRMGAEVKIVYRRTLKELPARREEVEHAMEEGVEFMFLHDPVEIFSDEDGWVTSICCRKMRLSEPDSSGRARPIPVSGSEFTFKTDCVIMALGTSPNPLIKETTEGLDTHSWGGIIADEKTGKTSKEGVYAGGDAVTGAATVILAMGAGKAAAKAMDEYIKSK